MPSLNITIRPARQVDLEQINRVIEAAIMTWDLPERVKRLSLSSYKYSEIDIKHLEIIVAEDDAGNIIGVAAWEAASKKDAPKDKSSLLLHGIYVDPAMHRCGVGKQLLREAEKAAQKHELDGLLVKAQQDANAFFIAMGMQQLEVEDPDKHYTNRFWKNLIKN